MLPEYWVTGAGDGKAAAQSEPDLRGAGLMKGVDERGEPSHQYVLQISGGCLQPGSTGFLIKPVTARKGNCLVSAACVSVCLPGTKQIDALAELPGT